MDISYVWESLEPHSRHWVIGIRSFDVVVTLLSRTLWQKGECSECSRLDWLRLVISGYKFPFQISKSSSLVLNVPMTLPCFWNWVSSIGSSGPARGFPRHGSKCYSEIAFHLITSHQYSIFHHLYIQLYIIVTIIVISYSVIVILWCSLSYRSSVSSARPSPRYPWLSTLARGHQMGTRIVGSTLQTLVHPQVFTPMALVSLQKVHRNPQLRVLLKQRQMRKKNVG